MPFPEFTHPEDVDKDVELFSQLVSGEIEFYRIEKRYIHKDGHTVWSILTVSSFTDQKGAMQVFGIVTDISERVALEESVREQNVQLQEAFATIKRLEGIIPICSYCHKIRDENQQWHRFEAYISKKTDAKFSHGICHDCKEREMRKLR